MRCSVLLLPLLLTSADAFSSLSRAMVSRVGGSVAACPAATSSLGRLTGAAAPALRAPPRRARAIAPSMGLVDREVITEGDGKTFPKNGDTLTVHYEGTLARGGTKFDSSYDRGEPIEFVIGEGQVIKGWDQGMLDMSLGEKATLKIAPFFGYGPQGSPPDIPPMSHLVFVVELLAINGQKA